MTSADPPTLGEFNSVEDLSRLLKVHASTIYRWIKDKRLKAIKTSPGKSARVLIRRKAVEDFLATMEG